MTADIRRMKFAVWSTVALLVTVFIIESSGQSLGCSLCGTSVENPSGSDKYDKEKLNCIYGNDIFSATYNDPHFVCYSLLTYYGDKTYWIERNIKRINETNIDASPWKQTLWQELHVCKTTTRCNDNSYAHVFGLPKSRSDLGKLPKTESPTIDHTSSQTCGATKEESTLSPLLITFVATATFFMQVPQC